MAKKKAQKKTTPYSPAGVTTYPSESAFNTAVSRRARSQLQPTLSDIRARRQQEIGASATRTRDIQGLYDYDLAARTAAQTRQQQALTGLLTAAGVSNADAQAGLSAALRPSQDANTAAASQLGVAAKGVDPQVAATLASYGKGNQMGLAGEFGSYLNNAAGDITLTGVGRREAGQREMGVNAANLRALDEERKAAMGTLPGLRDQARSSLLQEILANSQNKLAWRQFGESRRSNKAQEGLAEDQFGLAQDQQTLAEQQFGETKKQNKAQNKLNEEQLQLARDELDAKIDQATTEQELTQAQDQAKKFDSAVEWLQGWLAPTKQETGKKAIRKSYDSRIKNGFHTVLVQLMTQFGMDRATAYEVMRSAPPYRKKAEKFASAWEMRNRPT